MAKDAHIPPGRVLIVGLGNPGPRYAETRHNIGVKVLECLARRASILLSEQRFKALCGSGTIAGRQAVLLFPQTFMNVSGESVQPAAAFYKLGPESIVVVHDEIDLPPGGLRLKQGGGHAGHNGLRSIDQHLPSNQYFRVRAGVGRPPVPGGEVSSWVLGGFSAPERPVIEELVERCADAVETLMRDGLLAAQQRFHPVEKPTRGT
jgi:PTH1 family peptidyl-tRNA hydrolase